MILNDSKLNARRSALIGALASCAAIALVAAPAEAKRIGHVAPVGSSSCSGCVGFALHTAPGSPSYVVPRGRWKITSWSAGVARPTPPPGCSSTGAPRRPGSTGKSPKAGSGRFQPAAPPLSRARSGSDAATDWAWRESGRSRSHMTQHHSRTRPPGRATCPAGRSARVPRAPSPRLRGRESTWPSRSSVSANTADSRLDQRAPAAPMPTGPADVSGRGVATRSGRRPPPARGGCARSPGEGRASRRSR
jgi:hypothetical protein